MEAVQIGFLQFTAEHVMPTCPFPTNLTIKKQRPILWSVEKHIYHQLLPYHSNVNYCSCLISMKGKSLEVFWLFFLGGKGGIELPAFIWSTPTCKCVDLAKKSKFYKTQIAVLQLVCTAQCMAVAKGSNSTQPTSSVYMLLQQEVLAGFYQVNLSEHQFLYPAPCEATKMLVFA